MDGTRSSHNDLIDALNDLLVSLRLPFALERPNDLIPSLLLTILESILQSRLPIPANIRESRTPSDGIQAIKIFLGVLENDVITSDVGLSNMDPRRLAVGETDEVVFIGQLLCRLGRQKGREGQLTGSAWNNGDLPPMYFVSSRLRAGALSPSQSTIVSSPNSTYSFQACAIASTSDTTMMSISTSPTNAHSSVLDRSIQDGRSRRPPPCMRELEEHSFLPGLTNFGPHSEEENFVAEQSLMSYCECSIDDVSLSKYPPAVWVRYAGLLDEVDYDLELKSFESTRILQSHPDLSCPVEGPSRIVDRQPSTNPAVVAYHGPLTHHRLALLNKRAKLLHDSMTSRRRPSLAPLRLGSISEEEAPATLNLGIESPSSILQPSSAAIRASPDDWGKAGIAVNTNVPMRRRSWRSLSWLAGEHRRHFVAKHLDDDCGICFESAIRPVRVKCCCQLFCFVHLSDWLGSEQTDGLCPSCRKPCSISRDTFPMIPIARQTDAMNNVPTPNHVPDAVIRASPPSTLTCPPITPRYPSLVNCIAGKDAWYVSWEFEDQDEFGFGVAKALSYFAAAIMLLVLFIGP